MNTSAPVRLVLAVVLALSAVSLPAQTAISNIGQTVYGGNYGIGSFGAYNVGNAVSFTTGAASVDFTGVTVLLVASGTAQATGMHVTLNSGFGTGGTTGLLATLSGNTAPTTGTFSYTAAAPITLAANTTYWIETDAFTTAANTAFAWANTDSTGPVDAGGLAGWSLGTTTFYFTNSSGATWSPTAVGTKFPMFSVQYQAAVPEPVTAVWLLGLAAAGLVLWRRRRVVVA